MVAVDIVRFVIIILGAVVGASMIAVLLLHYRAWQSMRQADSGVGLLPLHVAAISLSHGIVSYGVIAAVYEQIGQPGTWRLPLYVIGFTLSIISLWIMATRQSRRIKFRRCETVTVTNDKSAELRDG